MSSKPTKVLDKTSTKRLQQLNLNHRC